MVTKFIHPEQNRGEVFFSNSDTHCFKRLRLRSKRMGVLTYDAHGNIIRSAERFPIFVKEKEVKHRDLDLLRMRFRTIQYR